MGGTFIRPFDRTNSLFMVYYYYYVYISLLFVLHLMNFHQQLIHALLRLTFKIDCCRLRAMSHRATAVFI